MGVPTNLQIETHEQKLVGIVRRLPLERVSQVIDFAQFLESQSIETSGDDLPSEDEKAIMAENARWDALLATDESQRLLEELADAALADIQAGHARPMVLPAEGEIAPG